MVNQMNGNQKNAVVRRKCKSSLLAAIMMWMGKVGISFHRLSDLTGIDVNVLRKQLRDPRHISEMRLEYILNCILDHLEYLRRTLP